MGACLLVHTQRATGPLLIDCLQIPNAQAMTIQLLGKEDLTLDDAHGSDVKLHQSWLASYVLVSPSEGIGAPVKAPLLKRYGISIALRSFLCVCADNMIRRNRSVSSTEEPPAFEIVPGLEAKVDERGYKLRFVAGTEYAPISPVPEFEVGALTASCPLRDCLYRRSSTASDDDEEESNTRGAIGQRRKDRFERWLHLQLHPEEAAEAQEGTEAEPTGQDDVVEGAAAQDAGAGSADGNAAAASPEGAGAQHDVDMRDA